MGWCVPIAKTHQVLYEAQKQNTPNFTPVPHTPVSHTAPTPTQPLLNSNVPVHKFVLREGLLNTCPSLEGLSATLHTAW